MESNSITNKDKLYGNHHFYHNDGRFMFHHNDKKANWYLSRNLASIISEEELDGEMIKHIQFKFVTKGAGHGESEDKFFNGIKKNRCVISGVEHDLTKHHIVPSMYRRHFPLEFKSHGQYHDVLLANVDSHDDYEKHADELKDEIAKELGLPTPHQHYGMYRKLNGILKTIRNNGHRIPEDRLYTLFSEFERLSGLTYTEDNADTIEGRINKQSKREKEYGRLVMSKVDDIQAFIERWRRHFIEHAKPKHMPEGWEVTKKISLRSEERKVNES